MEKYQQQIADSLKQIYPDLQPVFTTPPNSTLGDIALPCFSFARVLGKSPDAISEEFAGKLADLDFIEKVETKSGYLNFYIKKSILFKDIISEVLSKRALYGSALSGQGKQALVEHTSINPNASPHVGRARNAMIGDTIVRLLRFEGYKVEVHYFVNDIGKQIAMLMLGVMQHSGEVTFKDLLGTYVDINEQLAMNPELEKDVFSLLYRLEAGDEEIREAFRRLVDTCIIGQTEIFRGLGIKYDVFDYESDYIYNKVTTDVLDTLNQTGKLKEDEEGRLVLNQEEYKLPMKAPFLVLTRKDKTSLYPLRDIAYSIDKAKKGADLNIIVLGEDQKLYLQQIAAVLDLLGYKAPFVVHYSFVLLAEGKMATRKGNVVLLEDFMREAEMKALAEINKRLDKQSPEIQLSPEASQSLETEQFSEALQSTETEQFLSDKQLQETMQLQRDAKSQEVAKKSVDTAKAIGYGAVKYAILRASNDKNVIFDWESALSFEGDSGPYLQYSLARINSIFRKFNDILPHPDNIDFALLREMTEIDLVKELASFPGTIRTALRELSPHIIANYVYGLTKRFSSFYHDCPVLTAQNDPLKIARLALIDAAREVISTCLSLLGIELVESM